MGEYVCSLCCSLDTVCKGICKRPHAQADGAVQGAAGRSSQPVSRRLKIFCVQFLSVSSVLAVAFVLIYAYFSMILTEAKPLPLDMYALLFIFVLVIVGLWAWWFSLIQEYRLRAEDELDKHIGELEVEARKRLAISAALEETEKLQRLILENAMIGIAYVKNDYIVWRNKLFLEYGNINDNNSTTCLHVGLIFQDSRFYDALMANAQYTLRQKRRFVLELPISSQECRERWCILSISAVNPDCLQEGSIWLLNDISDHKLAEENLRRSEERLRELNESLESQVKVRTEELKKSYESIRQADKMASLGILVAGMAHEINNPISFILLNSSIIQNAWHDVNNLLDAYCRDNDQIWIAGMPYAYAKNGVEKLLKGIHQGAVRVSSIVRNLKEYAKQTPHDMTGVVSINKALTTSLELVRNDLRKATNNLHVEMESNLPDLRGDLLRIEQVLINLIQNAYQALPERSKAIFIRTYTRNGSICFEIADQGIGIPAEDLAHVLDPFFTTKREQGGTGLGLSVSAGIVEEHGGTLRIESVPGQGTCVSLAFPRDVNDGTALRGRNSCPHK